MGGCPSVDQKGEAPIRQRFVSITTGWQGSSKSEKRAVQKVKRGTVGPFRVLQGWRQRRCANRMGIHGARVQLRRLP